MALTEDEARQLVDQANAAYAAGDYHRAGEMFSSLLIEPELLDGSNQLHWNYAMCLAREGKWPLAIEHVQAGGYDVEEFRRTCRESDVRDAKHDFEQASQLYTSHQWDAAADAFTELLLHPGLAADQMKEIHWNIAMCLAHNGDLETALGHVRAGGYQESDFHEALAKSDDDLFVHDFEAAIALFRQQQYSEAADAFAALLLDPKAPPDAVEEMHYNLGVCLAYFGDWDAAFGHIRAAGHDEHEFRRRAVEQGMQPPEIDAD